MNNRIFSISIALALIFSNFLSAQSDEEKVVETVSKSGIEAKLQFLASDEMRGRDTPSPELEIAAKYLEYYLKDQGIKPPSETNEYMQAVNMKKTEMPTGGQIQIGDSTFAFDKELLLIQGEDATMSGEIVYLDYGSEEDFKGKDLNGKIVVVKIGEKGDASPMKAYVVGKEKAIMAEKAGAVALVELYISPQPKWQVIRYYLGSGGVGLDAEASNIPRIWLDDVAGNKKAFIENFKGEAKLSIEGAKLEKFQVSNVMGVVPGTDPKLKDEYIIFSAHYDHVGIGKANAEGDSIYNGTRDNAIGTTAVMEAAKNIARYPLKRSALFVFFPGEEKGLLGSEWYVNHPIIPLEKTILCLNADNGGYNDTTFAMIVGLERITSGDEIDRACTAFGLDAKPDQVLDQNLYARSDHYSFANAGVPGVMYGMACTAFDDEIFKYLHQPSDNPNTVDYNYLTKFISSYVYSGRLIGNAKKSNYWQKGDEYYEKGEKLYN